jgi:hypothetical protein
MMSLALGASLPAVAFASAELTPPTVAPVLTSSDLGEGLASLDWTPSNKTSSPGFGYRVTRNGSAYAETTLLYLHVAEGGDYYVTPFNDVGNGPNSNEINVIIT